MSHEELKASRILVVDDEERIRDACTMVLEEEGYEIASAESGELGLKMIEESHYDVILLDLMMPNISGLEVLPELTEKHPDTAVIVITGYATVEHSIEAMKKGAFDFIPKPFTPDQLRTVVEKSLKYIRALQDISDSKSRLRVMVNRLLDGVMTADTDKNIVLANPAFLNLMGAPAETVQGVQGKKVEDIIANAEILAAIDEVLTMPEDTIAEFSREVVLPGVSEEDARTVSVHCSPFRSRSGHVLGATMVLHDITVLKNMDRMKSDFVSMVSHEIRGPMNSLLAQMKIILDGLAGEVTDKQREILQRASGKITSLVDLVSELLDLSKIEAGMMGREREEVGVEPLLREQVAFHEAAATEKKSTIELHIEGNLPSLLLDRQGIEEVLTNLVTNAVKYSPEGSKITISAAVEDDDLAIRVSDNGYGIPEEDLAEIFNRFYRVKDRNTREIHGTGLGLAIVKSIVDAHQGSILVESKLEEGTTFTVLLPLAGE